ncbi:four-carbon acid sugar kinase family protein [Rhizobium puerariae]|uniref:Four-carbon acid sugar kinase family protein n=1 Tax=Rhizobium puerariae TaxID=1585791 RepID=A0ABV6AIH8_9HYPH
MQVLIVADDLTGALDSAVAFAVRGMRSCVLRHPAALATSDLSDVDVCAVSTGTRDGPEDAARGAIATVLAHFAGKLPDHVFKKVDSRLKGHVGLETGMLAEGAGRTRLLIAPAIPEMGRLVVGGRVTGMGVADPIDAGARFGDAVGEKLIPDIAGDADFEASLDRCEPRATLYVGARGLAAALARRLRPVSQARRTFRLSRPALFAIGSRDPITEAQVGRLLDACAPAFLAAGNGRFEAGVRLGDGLTVAKLTAGDHDIRADLAGARFADGLSDLIRQTPPATLLACGGETADALLKRLGADRLDIVDEILPGVPLAQTFVCGKKADIITKSGGFGDADTLVHLACAVEPVESVSMSIESRS